MIDCEGTPIGATTDTCTGETVRDWRMVARCFPGVVDNGAPTLPLKPVKDLLTRTLEAEADALSFPPAGSEWRNESGRSGVVEYRPNGRGWRLLYSDGGQSEWCHDGIAEGWERVPFEPAPAASCEAAPAAPQAITLEVAAINASEPGPYRSPADAHLPNFGVSNG